MRKTLLTLTLTLALCGAVHCADRHPDDISTTDYVHWYRGGRVVLKTPKPEGGAKNATHDWQEGVRVFYLTTGWQGDCKPGTYPYPWVSRNGKLTRVEIWK
jgi:hypothetical protein